jgi:hypothetical protein
MHYLHLYRQKNHHTFTDALFFAGWPLLVFVVLALYLHYTALHLLAVVIEEVVHVIVC